MGAEAGEPHGLRPPRLHHDPAATLQMQKQVHPLVCKKALNTAASLCNSNSCAAMAAITVSRQARTKTCRHTALWSLGAKASGQATYR